MTLQPAKPLEENYARTEVATHRTIVRCVTRLRRHVVTPQRDAALRSRACPRLCEGERIDVIVLGATPLLPSIFVSRTRDIEAMERAPYVWQSLERRRGICRCQPHRKEGRLCPLPPLVRFQRLESCCNACCRPTSFVSFSRSPGVELALNRSLPRHPVSRHRIAKSIKFV